MYAKKLGGIEYQLGWSISRIPARYGKWHAGNFPAGNKMREMREILKEKNL